MPAAIAAGVFW